MKQALEIALTMADQVEPTRTGLLGAAGVAALLVDVNHAGPRAALLAELQKASGPAFGTVQRSTWGEVSDLLILWSELDTEVGS